MAEIYYVLLFFVSLIFTAIYVFIWHRHFSVNFSLIFAFIPLAAIGYVYREQSANLSEYVLATKLIYLGGCFLILFIMFNVFDLCNIKLPKLVRLFAMIASTTVYLSVITIGDGSYFYKNLTFSELSDGFIVHKEYGP